MKNRTYQELAEKVYAEKIAIRHEYVNPNIYER